MAPKAPRAPRSMRSDDELETTAMVRAVADAMVEINASETADDIDEAEERFQERAAAIEKKFPKGGAAERSQPYREMVTTRIETRRIELHQSRSALAAEESTGVASEDSPGTGQFVHRLAAELRKDAEAAGIPWEKLLDESTLTKASRSRLNHGRAGITTLERVRTVLDRLRARPVERVVEPALAPSLESLRWVVAVERQGGMFAGRTNTPDTEVAERGYVRLRHCRTIRGDSDPVELANRGPGPSVEVGEPTPSVLVTGVARVYDCSPVASRAFQSTGPGRLD